MRVCVCLHKDFTMFSPTFSFTVSFIQFVRFAIFPASTLFGVFYCLSQRCGVSCMQRRLHAALRFTGALAKLRFKMQIEFEIEIAEFAAEKSLSSHCIN